MYTIFLVNGPTSAVKLYENTIINGQVNTVSPLDIGMLNISITPMCVFRNIPGLLQNSGMCDGQHWFLCNLLTSMSKLYTSTGTASRPARAAWHPTSTYCNYPQLHARPTRPASYCHVIMTANLLSCISYIYNLNWASTFNCWTTVIHCVNILSIKFEFD